MAKQTLEFKKTTLKEVGFKYRESELLVQAIKTLGKEGVDDKVISKLRRKFAPDACKQILKDTKMTRVWVYAVIKKVCQKVEQ